MCQTYVSPDFLRNHHLRLRVCVCTAYLYCLACSLTSACVLLFLCPSPVVVMCTDEKKISGNKNNNKNTYIAFISGLSIGMANRDPLPLQLMVDYLTGFVGSSQVRSILFYCKTLLHIVCKLTYCDCYYYYYCVYHIAYIRV